MSDVPVDRMIRHLVWADRQLLAALQAASEPPERAVALFGHVLGAEETWLARVQGRTPELPVWPTRSLEDYASVMHTIHDGIEALLAAGALDREVHYTNSAGREFGSSVLDILLHVAMHGMYHRGQVNALLREAGWEPAPMDYIGWRRGAPAATRDPPA